MKYIANSELEILVSKDLDSISLKPIEKDYLKVILFNYFIIIFLFFCGILGTHYFYGSWVTTYLYEILGGYIVLSFILVAYQYKAFLQRGYAIREQDIIYRYGLLKSNIEIFPYSRIQHTSLQESWMSRLLGLKSITVYTAGSTDSDLTINGLPKVTAEQINDYILNHIKKEHKEESEIIIKDDNQDELTKIPENEPKNI